MRTPWLYTIVWGKSTSDLSQQINQQIKYGWEPFGGVCSGERDLDVKDKHILYQAMVQYKDLLNPNRE